MVVPQPQIEKLPKNSQNNGFKICELIWVGTLPPLLNEGNIFPSRDDFRAGSIKKTNPILISKSSALKTTIDIPIIISYVT